MKTKIPHLILAGLFGATIASQGASVVTVDVSDADFDPDAGQFGTVSVGTLVRDQNVVDGAGPQDLILTVSGLTLDDDGTANDSVTITLTATASSTINSGYNNANQGFFAVGSWLGSGQWTRMDFTDISVNASSGKIGSAEFLGFTELTVQIADDGGAGDGLGDPGDSFDVNGTSYSFPFASGDIAIANEDFILLEYTGGSAPTFRHLDMNFSFTAVVPEPSSSALLGLGALALALRRRRS